MSENRPAMLETVQRYIAHRRSSGYKLDADSYLLRSFARYAGRHAPGQPLTTKLALRWATELKTTCNAYLAKRLTAVRSFARYLVAFEPRTEIPPTGIFRSGYARREPYIYTKEETVALMRTALTIKAQTRAARTNGLRNATVIGLMACTGMRIGEVLALENKDVDLTEGIIMVRNSKNLPMRLVPVTGRTVDHLREYQKARDGCFGPLGESDAFIYSSWRGRLTRYSFEDAFGLILKRAGLKSRDVSGRSPRLQDFRHTFACNHLLRAYREKRNIDDAVHDLSVYIGHANIAGTYWYLTAVPVLFEQCVKRFEAQFQNRRRGEPS